MWLHGRDAQQRRKLAEVIEDHVQTEEGRRRLRRLSSQLCLVASAEIADLPIHLPGVTDASTDVGRALFTGHVCDKEFDK